MPTYDFSCSQCNSTVERYTPSWRDEVKCQDCGSLLEKVWALGNERFGYSAFPFTTTAITGKPLTITSPGHLREVQKVHGVVQRDDPSFLTKEHAGAYIERVNGRQVVRQRYKESSRGNKGQWF